VNLIPDIRVLIVQALGFLLVLMVFKMFLFKPIMDILDARRSEIEGQFDSAEEKRKQAEELKAQYEKSLEAIDDEMRSKIAQAVKEGQAMRDEIIVDSRAKADDILAKAQAEIMREKEMALVELKTTVADLTINAAGKLIDRELDDAKHRELISQFIGELDGVSK